MWLQVINDVGYTDSDLAAHRARLDSDIEGAVAAAQLHAVPGLSPTAQSREDAAARAAEAMDTLIAQRKMPRRAAGRRSTSPADRVLAAAGRGGQAMGSLGMPPHPVGMPPSERVSSFYSSLYQ